MARRRIRWSSGSTRPGGILRRSSTATSPTRSSTATATGPAELIVIHRQRGAKALSVTPLTPPTTRRHGPHDDRRWQLANKGSSTPVVLNIMYEQWAPGTAPGLGPVGNPLPGGVLDYQALSWSEYGPRTGIWRLLELLDRFDAQAIGLPERHSSPRRRRPALRAIVDAGHEICGHGWSQDVITPTLDQHTERRMIHRAADVLEAATGQRPVGWVSPRCTPSDSTAGLLAEAGSAGSAMCSTLTCPTSLRRPPARLSACHSI